MSYEIPQQLEYQEKIIFGLTFKQLAYLFVFAPIVMIIFFKTNMHYVLKFFFVCFFSGLAVGFMFLKLDEHLKNWYIWYKSRIIEKREDMRKFIPIKTIKDKVVITTDNRKLAILKIEPLNFSIKPKESKDAITEMFRKFLNSLNFPIQIIMNTETLDLQEYFDELDKKIKENGKFQKLFEEYKEHLLNVTKKNNVLNRSFYVVIPEKTDLDIQIQICKEKLNSIGLKSRRVGDLKLRELIIKYFEGNNSFFPKKIENTPTYLKIGKTYSRTIFVHGYPRSVESGFLDKIVSSLGNFDLSIHIEPYDIETMMITLNRELQKQRADLYSAKQKGIINPSLDIKYEDTKGVLKSLQKGQDKLYNVSLYLNCRAESKEELDLLTRKIESELNSLLIIPKQPMFRLTQGFQSCSPLAINSLKMNRNITTKALSAFFPFTSSFLQADKTGVWLGLNKNNIPIIKDIFTFSNPNGLCLASSGAGKSYMAKLLISRYLLNGTKVMVIDPQGEYANLVKRFNGERIDLSRTSKTIINPLDLMGHSYPEKRLALMDLMPIMLGDLTEPQKSFIDKALTIAYEKKGITHNPDSWNNRPPILEDVLVVLEKIEKRATSLEKSTIRSLINRLDMYVNGVFSFLNKHTNIDFGNKFVCFDIGNMPKQVKPTIMFLVLDYIYMRMKESIERKLLVIDEAWSLLGRSHDASYIFEIVKTCRKFNLALFLINQEVEGMLDSGAGKAVLANSSYTLLMRQKPAVIRKIKDTFFLSEAEKTHLLTAGVGEGIFLMDDEHSEVKIIASKEEHKLITTNPDEILENNTRQVLVPKSVRLKNVNIGVDEEKGYYKLQGLNKEDKKYLLRKGYKEVKLKGVENKVSKYLIKVRRGESPHHGFLTYNIAEYLKKFTDKIELYETTKPDIVFKIKNKTFAIEVETGKVYKDKKKFLNKVNLLNKQYNKNWFFVVTHHSLANKYKKYGKTLTKRNFVQEFKKMLKTI